MTTVAREYSEAYPRAGNAAILCEGDLVGYEAGLLRKWVDTCVGCSPLVDIWPCGTSSAIYGLCDSIGRSRPILVIEDRDFRDVSDVQKDCKDKEKDRRKRGVKLLGWCTWRRNEIENYFLEPTVLYPVMADAFACKDDDVRQVLGDVIPALALYQSVQDVLYRARRVWEDSRLATDLVRGVDAWPACDDGKGLLKAPDQSAIRNGLKDALGRLPELLEKKRTRRDRLKLLERFDVKCEAWSKIGVDSQEWRLDWCGKEVLQVLRIGLTARYGWRDRTSGVRSKLSWQNLSRKAERDTQDRPIEAALRPPLVQRFLEYLEEDNKCKEIRMEFAKLQDILRNWNNVRQIQGE